MEQKTAGTEAKLSREVTQLFDTIYELCGDNSTILTKIVSSKEEATKNRNTEEKELEQKEKDVKTYKENLDTLSAQIEKFKEDFKNFDKDEYHVLLTELNIDFDPQALVKKVIEESPVKVEKMEEMIKVSEEECSRLSSEINNLEIEISELDQAYSKALSDQEELKELLEEVRAGNEQITKQKVVSIGRALQLTDEQINLLGQRLLFSDDLNIYYANLENEISGKNIGDLLEEAKTAAIDEEVEDKEEEKFDFEKDETINSIDVASDNFDEKLNILTTAAKEEEAKVKNSENILDQFSVEEEIKKANEKNNKSDDNIAKAEEYGLDISNEDKLKKDNELGKKLEKLNNAGIEPNNLPFSIYSSSVDNFITNMGELNKRGIKLDSKELNEFSAPLYVDSKVFKANLDLIQNYDVNLTKQSGKLALPVLAQPTTTLASKIDAVIEAGETDILRLNPEFLAKDTLSILRRIAFLKANGMEYRTNDEKHKYKRLLDDSIQFEKEFGNADIAPEILVDFDDNNKALASIADNEELNNLLKDYYSKDLLIEDDLDTNKFLVYTGISQSVEEVAEITDYTYVIEGIPFSINKFQRNLTHILVNDSNVDFKVSAFVALAYNSQKTTEELNAVAKAMGFNLAMRGER